MSQISANKLLNAYSNLPTVDQERFLKNVHNVAHQSFDSTLIISIANAALKQSKETFWNHFKELDSKDAEKIVDGCLNQYSEEKCLTSLFESAYFWAK